VPCTGNTGVGSCGTLPPNFQCVPGAKGPGVYDGNLQLRTNNGFGIDPSMLAGLTCVTGYLSIYSTDLTDLHQLSSLQAVGGIVNIFGNASLTSLSGLEQLTTVGSLYIESNPLLGDLSPLSLLSSLGANPNDPNPPTLSVQYNPSMPACWAWGLEGQTGKHCGHTDSEGTFVPCTGNTGVGNCGTLPPNFQCVPGAKGPGVYDGNLQLRTNNGYGIDPSMLSGLTCVTGYLSIYSTDLTDLHQLSSLQAVGSTAYVFGNASLTSLSGLEQLTTIGTALVIDSNPLLADLAGLSELTTLGEANVDGNHILEVFDNQGLAACWVGVLETQTNHDCGYFDSQNTWLACTGNDGAGTCTP
jgi:hypothetical protein